MRCAIGKDTYGIELSSVVDFRELDQAGDSISDTLPVVSLAERLGYSPRNGKTKSIITLKTRGGEWDLEVDRVLEPVSVSSERVFPLPSLIDNRGESVFKGVIHLPSEADSLLEKIRSAATGSAGRLERRLSNRSRPPQTSCCS